MSKYGEKFEKSLDKIFRIKQKVRTILTVISAIAFGFLLFVFFGIGISSFDPMGQAKSIGIIMIVPFAITLSVLLYCTLNKITFRLRYKNVASRTCNIAKYLGQDEKALKAEFKKRRGLKDREWIIQTTDHYFDEKRTRTKPAERASRKRRRRRFRRLALAKTRLDIARRLGNCLHGGYLLPGCVYMGFTLAIQTFALRRETSFVRRQSIAIARKVGLLASALYPHGSDIRVIHSKKIIAMESVAFAHCGRTAVPWRNVERKRNCAFTRKTRLFPVHARHPVAVEAVGDMLEKPFYTKAHGNRRTKNEV